jgi:hypothetical protein
MNLPIPILSALIGAVILFFGRKLFWLCVAAVGFAAGGELATHFLHQPTPLMALTIALVLGFIGALIALFLQKMAIAIAGFVVNLTPSYWITFVIGGIIGAVLLLSLFDWALIFFSAVVGAYLIQSAVTLPSTGSAILFIALAAVGFFVQAAAIRKTSGPIA